jgi:VIT1/CCC1 family predicted Fe2+/Mn2+ transporter
MNLLEIIGTLASLVIVGVSLMWVLASTARAPKNGVVQRRRKP